MTDRVPIAPIFLGPLGYSALVAGDSPREVLPPEEAFWARLTHLMGEGYHRSNQQGAFAAPFGRAEFGIREPMPSDLSSEAAGASLQAKPTSFQLRPGVEVSVLRSTGEREAGWTLKGETSAGQVLLTKDSPIGLLSKLLGVEELLRQNLSLLPEGMAVKVPRSSGALDEGWVIRGVKSNRLLVEKPGVGRKQLVADQFFPFNRELWGGPAAERHDRDLRTFDLRTFDLKPGMGIRLKRSTGAWDSSWQIEEQEGDKHVRISRESEQGLVRMKRSIEEIVEQNPQLIPLGIPVRVPRSNGHLEDGWFVLEATLDHLVVECPGVGSKVLSIDELLANNRDRLFGEGVGPSMVPSAEAVAQRWAYSRLGRLEGWICDGFAEGGRDVSLDSNGWPQDPLREVLIVDRLSDVALRGHLARARELASMPSLERSTALARYVYDLMGGAIAPIEARVALTAARYRAMTILIGDVPRHLGGGLARHRALLFQVLAEEAGLKPTLVRGVAGVTCPCAHAWNELEWTQGERVLVDLAREPQSAFALATQEWTRQFYQPLTLPGSGGAV